MPTKSLMKFFNKQLAPLRINLAHSFDVAKEEALGDKLGESRLINGRRLLIHHAPDFDESVHQPLRGNKKSETQRWDKESCSLSRHR